MMLHIAVIPGDGIGPEVMAEALPALEWARLRGRELTWEVLPYGADRFLATGKSLQDEEFAQLRDGFDAILFGAVGDPRVPDGRHAEDILLRLRRDLHLGVNFRPCTPLLDRLVPLREATAASIQIEVFRENTEGPYCLRGETRPGEAIDLALHTEPAVERLLREAFRRAALHQRPLHLAHKANVLKHGHGLWLRAFERMRAEFPAVEARTIHADALLCALVQSPQTFGVIAADNFIGDLVSDLLAAYQGGLGMAASASYDPSPRHRCSALYEPVHGSAPALTGRQEANPVGMILCVSLLFRRLGWEGEAQALEAAVRSTLAEGLGTRDLGGSLSTRDLGAAIRRRLPGAPSSCA